jgi:hypothetical protein
VTNVRQRCYQEGTEAALERRPAPPAPGRRKLDGGAEAEISVRARQCQARRIPDEQALRREVAAWQQARNAKSTKAQWQFTTPDARVKLASPCPQFE